MVRRVALAAACLAALIIMPLLEAHADCPMTQVIGQWDRDNQGARLHFFSNKKVACRLCDPKVSDRCRYIYDPTDAQGRKHCPFKQPGGKETTLTGWTARDGKLDTLSFADGTEINVGKGCRIDGKKGTMQIDGLGTFVCGNDTRSRKLEK